MLNNILIRSLLLLIVGFGIANAQEQIMDSEVETIRTFLREGMPRNEAEGYLTQMNFSINYEEVDEIENWYRIIEEVEGEYDVIGKIHAISEPMSTNGITSSYLDIVLYFDRDNKLVVSRVKRIVTK